MNSTIPALAFQDVLKNSAVHYLQRHQAEHLTGDDLLFTRAIEHLVLDYQVSNPTAEKAVHLAMTDLGLYTANTAQLRAKHP